MSDEMPGWAAAMEARLQAEFGLLRSDVTVIRSDVTLIRFDVIARMDRLQDLVTLIRDDIAVNYGSTSAA